MFTNNIDPVLINLGPFEIRYYGLFFVIGFILAYYILKHFSRKGLLKLNEKQIEDFLVYTGIGGVLGARIFYILVYNLQFSSPRRVIQF